MNHCDYCAQFVSPPARILDVGSGSGKFLCEMAIRGFFVYGVEVNQQYIDNSLARAVKENVKIEISSGRGESLPFIDNYFDFINCSEVSEHVNNPWKMCQEIYRVLKPGGRCYISFHNRFGFYDYHYRLYLINWLPRRWAEPILELLGKQKEDSSAGRQTLSTMHYFTLSTVQSMLQKTGFTVKDIREEKIKKYFHFWSKLLLVIYFLLRPFYFNTFHLILLKEDNSIS